MCICIDVHTPWLVISNTWLIDHSNYTVIYRITNKVTHIRILFIVSLLPLVPTPTKRSPIIDRYLHTYMILYLGTQYYNFQF